LPGTSVHHQTVIGAIKKAGKTQAVEVKVFLQTHRGAHHTYYFLAQHPERFQSTFKKLLCLGSVTPHIEVAPVYRQLREKLPSETELELIYDDFSLSLPTKRNTLSCKMHKLDKPDKPAQPWLPGLRQPPHSLTGGALS
ncbi:hypothetical protein H2201_009044, partial [Coniosporium apollinis]